VKFLEIDVVLRAGRVEHELLAGQYVASRGVVAVTRRLEQFLDDVIRRTVRAHRENHIDPGTAAEHDVDPVGVKRVFRCREQRSEGVRDALQRLPRGFVVGGIRAVFRKALDTEPAAILPQGVQQCGELFMRGVVVAGLDLGFETIEGKLCAHGRGQ